MYIKPRKTLRRGEPTSAEKQEARIRCHERAGGICELQCSPQCHRGPLPIDGDLFERMHLAHLHGKRRFGWFESDAQKHLCACQPCHAYEHAGRKPAPAKERP